VRQILAPLIENARRHAIRAVRVQVNTAPHTVRVAVRDDGPGVDPGLGDSVFEPGARDRAGSGSGAGLGLALARRLARACGGDIVLGPGPGGHFVVVLAAVGSAGAPGGGHAASPSMTGLAQSG
jgi:signal transduction histidine kinase